MGSGSGVGGLPRVPPSRHQTAAAAGPRPGAAATHWNLQDHQVSQETSQQGQEELTHEAVPKAAGTALVQQVLLGHPSLVVPLPFLSGPQLLQLLLLLLLLGTEKGEGMSVSAPKVRAIMINLLGSVLLLLLV